MAWVGLLREALQLVAERLVTVVNQKGYRVAPMSEQELLDIFDARANMEAMLVRLADERGGDGGKPSCWPAPICSTSWSRAKRVSAYWMNGTSAIRRFTPPSSPAAAPSICCRCANGCSIWRRATASSGCAPPCCRWRCWKISMSSIRPVDAILARDAGTGQRADARALTDSDPDYSAGDGWQAVAAGRVSQMEGWKLRVWRHASPRRTGVEKSYP